MDNSRFPVRTKYVLVALNSPASSMTTRAKSNPTPPPYEARSELTKSDEDLSGTVPLHDPPDCELSPIRRAKGRGKGKGEKAMAQTGTVQPHREYQVHTSSSSLQVTGGGTWKGGRSTAGS
jgi:hypothetical protein